MYKKKHENYTKYFLDMIVSLTYLTSGSFNLNFESLKKFEGSEYEYASQNG